MASAGARRLFLNAGGGTFHHGFPDDPSTNTTSTLDGSHTIAPWSNAASLGGVEACLGWMLADFDLALTDVDPGAAPHLELVLSGTPPEQLGLDPDLWATGPLSCTAAWHEIQWVFPAAMTDDPAAICELIAYTVGRSIGLDVVTGCGDIMAEHIFDPTCSGTFTDEVRTCSNGCGCTRLPTQSSRATMLAYFGPCPR